MNREIAIDTEQAFRPRELGVSVQPIGAWKGLGPPLFFLLIELARPMVWVPPLAALRPGLLATLWGAMALLFYRKRSLPQAMRYVLGFYFLMSFGVFTAYNWFYAYTGWYEFTLLLLGCVLPVALLPKTLHSLRVLLTAYVLFHVPTAIWAVGHKGMGLGSWMQDENDLAFALNTAIGIGIYLTLETRSSFKKLILVASMGVMVVAIVASISRGGVVGLASLLAYLVITGKRKVLMIFLVILLLVGIFLAAPPEFWEEMGTISTAAEHGDTGAKRLYFWSIATQMFMDFPITGVGANNFGARAPDYRDLDRFPDEHMWRRVSHSLFFTLLPEHGLIGILLLLLGARWWYRAQRRLIREWKAHPDDVDARAAGLMSAGLTAGMIAIQATGLFISVLYYPAMWILLGMMAALDAVRPPMPAPPRTAEPREMAGRRRMPMRVGGRGVATR